MPGRTISWLSLSQVVREISDLGGYNFMMFGTLVTRFILLPSPERHFRRLWEGELKKTFKLNTAKRTDSLGRALPLIWVKVVLNELTLINLPVN